jgi:hypothetical protein
MKSGFVYKIFLNIPCNNLEYFKKLDDEDIKLILY